MMLIASGWPFRPVVPEGTGFHHPNVRSGVRSRQAVGAGPGDPCLSAWRFRDRFDALPFRSVSPQRVKRRFPSFLSDRRRGDLLTARHSLHLRFAALDPKIACGVFSDAAAGIAARS
ncbi:MAG: hypothetical protein KGM18_07020 [Sphingomonadales bacterium]|nr:hypothetical protein [Sphingomonadales bacterium]